MREPRSLLIVVQRWSDVHGSNGPVRRELMPSGMHERRNSPRNAVRQFV